MQGQGWVPHVLEIEYVIVEVGLGGIETGGGGSFSETKGECMER